jgi:hypothetical protein
MIGQTVLTVGSIVERSRGIVTLHLCRELQIDAPASLNPCWRFTSIDWQSPHGSWRYRPDFRAAQSVLRRCKHDSAIQSSHCDCFLVAVDHVIIHFLSDFVLSAQTIGCGKTQFVA